jgi:hypothetical protein
MDGIGREGKVLVWQIVMIFLVAVLASRSVLVRRCAWQFGGDTCGVLGFEVGELPWMLALPLMKWAFEMPGAT